MPYKDKEKARISAINRTRKYQQAHPDIVRAYRKKYKDANADKIHCYNLAYYETVYKPRRKEKVMCVCGRMVSRKHLPAHQRTNLHERSIMTAPPVINTDIDHYCIVTSDHIIYQGF